MFKKLIPFILATLTCFTGCHSSSNPSPTSSQAPGNAVAADSVATAVQIACERRVDAGLFQGVIIRFVSPSESTTIFCGDANSDQAKYELGSISKSFTGIELAKLSLAGKLDLNEAISNHIPELTGTFAGSLTPTQLATHTAQLVRDLPGNSLHYSESDLINFLKNYQPDIKLFPAGQRNYSNLGFGTLGLLLSRVSGRSFADLIQQEILDPLKMNETGFMNATVAPSDLLQGYDVLLRAAPYFYLSDLSLAWGGVISNLHDMVLFLNANMHPDSTALGLAITLSQTQGLGWDSLPGVHPIWKDGAMSDGYSTLIQFSPESNTGLVALGNEFSSPSVVALGSVAMGSQDNSVMNSLSTDFLNQAVGIYKNADRSVEIDVFPVHTSYLGIEVKQSGSPSEPFRLLSLAGSDLRFSVDEGSTSSDRLEFKFAGQESGLTYFESNGADKDGQPIYNETVFTKQ